MHARPAPVTVVALLLCVSWAGCFGTPPGADDTVTDIGPSADGDVASGPSISAEEAIGGLDQPVALTHAGDGSGRIFVVEQGGRVWYVHGIDDPSRLLFVDVSDRVSSGGERGLFAIAFHPGFVDNGRYFLHYTDRNGDTVVEERHTGDGSVTTIMTVDQPFSNHNGGALAFGPDGYLYVGLGDGGGGGDPHENAQDLGSLLGKILRLDVDDVAAGEGYGIPDDNPFVATEGARAEIWAYGLRNPWRFAFDRDTGDLWIGDVGQNKWEEVDRQPASSQGGENYGWNVWEGSERFRPGDASGDVVFPVAAYRLEEGRCAIQGGTVVRSASLPSLAGAYLFADYCSQEVFVLRAADDGAWAMSVLLEVDGNPTAFGEDEAGNVYMTLHSGEVVRFYETQR